MAVTPQFSQEDVRKRFKAFMDEVQKKQIARLQLLGEKCITYARNLPPEKGFNNQTGNLRSSMGYMVFVDGVAVHTSTFEQVPSVNNPPEGTQYNGSETGKNLCASIGKDTEGVALVCVAGMNYALYVESKGRDVLTGAENLAKEELPKMMEQLVNNIKRAVEE